MTYNINADNTLTITNGGLTQLQSAINTGLPISITKAVFSSSGQTIGILNGNPLVAPPLVSSIKHETTNIQVLAINEHTLIVRAECQSRTDFNIGSLYFYTAQGLFAYVSYATVYPKVVGKAPYHVEAILEFDKVINLVNNLVSPLPQIDAIQSLPTPNVFAATTVYVLKDAVDRDNFYAAAFIRENKWISINMTLAAPLRTPLGLATNSAYYSDTGAPLQNRDNAFLAKAKSTYGVQVRATFGLEADNSKPGYAYLNNKGDLNYVELPIADSKQYGIVKHASIKSVQGTGNTDVITGELFLQAKATPEQQGTIRVAPLDAFKDDNNSDAVTPSLFRSQNATVDDAGTVKLADTDTMTVSNNEVVVTPFMFFQTAATPVRRGTLKMADETTMVAGNIDSAVTPDMFFAFNANIARRGVIKLASGLGVSLSNNTDAVTPYEMITYFTAQAPSFAPAVHTHDASAIVSGTIDPARLPAAVFAAPIIASSNIASLTSPQQSSISGGSVVVTSDGRFWIYKGPGSKTLEASYQEMADVTPDWSIIANKPSFTAPATAVFGTTAGTVAQGNDSRFLQDLPFLFQFTGATDDAKLANAISLSAPGIRLSKNISILSEKILPTGFVLDGGGFTITKAANTDMFRMSEKSQIINAKIAGAGATYTGVAIAIKSGNNQKLINVDVLDMENYCLKFYDTAEGGTDNCGQNFKWIGGAMNRVSGFAAIQGPNTESAIANRVFSGLSSYNTRMFDFKAMHGSYIDGCDMGSVLFSTTTKRIKMRNSFVNSDMSLLGYGHDIAGVQIGGSNIWTLGIGCEACRITGNVGDKAVGLSSKINHLFGFDELAYTPVLNVSAGGPVNLGTGGSITGFIRRIEDRVRLRVVIKWGTSPTVGSGFYTIGLPTANDLTALLARRDTVGGRGFYIRSTTDRKSMHCVINAGLTFFLAYLNDGTATFFGSSWPYAIAAGDEQHFEFEYEVGS